MAHLIETMAYTGTTPWHGIGHSLTRGQPIDVWARQAGMDWQICEAHVRFMTNRIDSLNAMSSS